MLKEMFKEMLNEVIQLKAKLVARDYTLVIANTCMQRPEKVTLNVSSQPVKRPLLDRVDSDELCLSDP